MLTGNQETIPEVDPAQDAAIEASAQAQDISNIATPNVIENVELVKHLAALGEITTGNDLVFSSDPDAQFRTMWGAMEQAQQCILLETYIFDPDGVGLHTLEILEAALRRGVKVYLIMDGFGSNKMVKKGDKHLKTVKSLGAVVCYYNPIVRGLRHNFKQNVLLRDHRKILVVDWVIGFTGGINYSKEFGGLETYGDDFFRDTLIQIRGPAVSKLTLLVCELVNELKRTKVLSQDTIVPCSPASIYGFAAPNMGMPQQTPLDPAAATTIVPLVPPPCGTFTAQILEADPSKQRRVDTVQTSMLFMIRYAKKFVHITNPYFMPIRALSRELSATAKRGVPVTIIAAGHCDHYSVHLASQHVYRKLLKNGVRIFELQNHTLHAKTIVVDGAVASVGSYNLDLWSGWTSLEATVNLFDEGSVNELEKHFQVDLAVSKEVMLEDLMGRSVMKRFSYWTALNLFKLIRVNKSLTSSFHKNHQQMIEAPTYGAPYNNSSSSVPGATSYVMPASSSSSAVNLHNVATDAAHQPYYSVVNAPSTNGLPVDATHAPIYYTTAPANPIYNNAAASTYTSSLPVPVTSTTIPVQAPLVAMTVPDAVTTMTSSTTPQGYAQGPLMPVTNVAQPLQAL